MSKNADALYEAYKKLPAAEQEQFLKLINPDPVYEESPRRAGPLIEHKPGPRSS